MKNNLFKKSISALTAVAVCASMVSFPVFAEENIISNEESSVVSVPMTPEEAKQFVDSYSYNDEYKQIAQYIVDHADDINPELGVLDFALAKDLMDKFIEGEKLVGNSGNTSSNKLSKIDAYYYNREYLHNTNLPHYILAISKNVNPGHNVNFKFEGIDSHFKILSDENYYETTSLEINPEINYDFKYNGLDRWEYNMTIQFPSDIDEIKEYLVEIPVTIGKSVHSEYQFYDVVKFEKIYEKESKDEKFDFDIFLLGDVNHDGQVDEADTTMLMSILAGLDTFGHQYKDGVYQSEITNRIASDVNFDGTVDIEDLKLIKASIDGTYKLGDPVPENPIVTTTELVTTTTITTKIDKSSVPMTAEEAKQFVDSYAYNDDYKKMAQYIVDHADDINPELGVLDFALAKDLMDKYIAGEKLVGTSTTTTTKPVITTTTIMENSISSVNPVEAKKFVNSYAYNSLYKKMAQYIVDNWDNLDEAKDMMDTFIEGEKVFISEGGTVNNDALDTEGLELVKAYFDANPSQEKDTTLYGDVNGDEKISLIDVIFMNKAIAGSYIIPESLKSSADVYKDSDINLDDTLILLKYLINLVELPVIPE
ncbi:MAG: dockerin type I repeat-containing protein [Ruminococcus sp.]|nr:dockerin type I repeat-containing protein [Ruminococcus sp.]